MPDCNGGGRDRFQTGDERYASSNRGHISTDGISGAMHPPIRPTAQSGSTSSVTSARAALTQSTSRDEGGRMAKTPKDVLEHHMTRFDKGAGRHHVRLHRLPAHRMS